MPGKSNIEKAVRNSSISVIAQILTMFLQLINRRVFIYFLDIEFLGYQSLFGNVLSLLSVAELGIVNVISIHLYEEFNNNNIEEIGKLMQLYKLLYRLVAGVVLVLGSILFFFLPAFVKEPNADWPYLRIVYALQLSAIIFGYFLSYRRVIYFVDQKEYLCKQIDLYISFAIQILQLAFLFFVHNYLVYLCINLSTTLIANFIIYLKSNKDYPLLKKKYIVTQEDIKRRNVVSDLSNLLVHKIAVAVYSGTDNIVISMFCGIREVALYGNYIFLQKGVLQLALYSLLNPIQATIGNIVHQNRDKETLWKQFEILDVFSFFFASYISMGFWMFYQPVIKIWMGEEYILSNIFVMLNVFTIYFGVLWEIACKYRTVLGDYRYDRNYMILSAIANIAFSVPGAICFGVVGVQLGTLISFMPIGIGRISFVVKGFFEKDMNKYLSKHMILFVVFISEGLLASYLAEKMTIGYQGIVSRIILWLVMPGVTGYIVYHNNIYFKGMMDYLHRVYETLKSKIKRNK